MACRLDFPGRTPLAPVPSFAGDPTLLLKAGRPLTPGEHFIFFILLCLFARRDFYFFLFPLFSSTVSPSVLTQAPKSVLGAGGRLRETYERRYSFGLTLRFPVFLFLSCKEKKKSKKNTWILCSIVALRYFVFMSLHPRLWALGRGPGPSSPASWCRPFCHKTFLFLSSRPLFSPVFLLNLRAEASKDMSTGWI